MSVRKGGRRGARGRGEHRRCASASTVRSSERRLRDLAAAPAEGVGEYALRGERERERERERLRETARSQRHARTQACWWQARSHATRRVAVPGLLSPVAPRLCRAGVRREGPTTALVFRQRGSHADGLHHASSCLGGGTCAARDVRADGGMAGPSLLGARCRQCSARGREGSNPGCRRSRAEQRKQRCRGSVVAKASVVRICGDHLSTHHDPWEARGA